MQKSQYICDLLCEKAYWFSHKQKNLQINSSPAKKYHTW